jgi:TRAP transporter TAXI family solute receptor
MSIGRHARRALRRTAIQGLLVLVFCVSPAGAAPATELGLITAGERGTYYQFGLDLKNLVKPRGINLNVYSSRGSVDNIFALHQSRPRIQMAIVQSDVLDFVASQPSNPAVSQIARSTRLLFPLFDEEIHVVARAGIANFDELDRKRVAVGPDGSGTALTARVLFKLAGIVPAEIVAIDAREALARLKAGDIDAMVYVAAAPVKLLTEHVTAADRLSLIAISNKSILEAYARVEIPAQRYEWQPTAVTTVAVKAVLVSSALSGRNCESVGRFAQHVATGMNWLVRHGDPRWKHVDLNVPVNGWKQDACVRKHVGAQDAHASRPSSEETPR